MAVPFPDIDPYHELSIDSKASPSQIKRLYYKLCLRYHPDKLSLDDKEDDEIQTRFHKIQFSYDVLSDTERRKRFDQTGSLELSDATIDGDFNWKDYFDGIKMDEITPEKIELDKVQYQDSPEEDEDLLEMYNYYDGDFLKLFESIPHSEFTIDEQRFLDKIDAMIKEKKISSTKKYKKYIQNRDKLKKKEIKKLAKELKELEELKKMLNISKLPSSMDELSMMIQNRGQKRQQQSEAFFALLEQKYSEPKKKKKRL